MRISKCIFLLFLITIISVNLNASFLDNWVCLYKGIEYHLERKKDGKIRIHIIKIDGNDPDIDIFVTPPRDRKRTTGIKPSTFLSQQKAQVVINGTGYSPAELSTEGVEKKPETMSVYQGTKYAKSRKENAAFVVLKDGSKKIIKAHEYSKYEKDISMGIGAWPWAGVQGLLIEDGVGCVPNDLRGDQITARSAIGISQDEKSVYFVVIEGSPRQESIYKELVSEGMSLMDLMKILQGLGCYNAINLDGGGSSTMVIENIINHKPLVLNTPSDHKGERAVGSHIGIRAPRIEGEEQYKIFRSLQEESSYFDLLSSSESALHEKYMDQATLTKLNQNVEPLSGLYKRFGVSQYTDYVTDYNRLFESKGKSFESCFYQNRIYDFYCGDPKIYLNELGIRIRDNIIKLSSLKFVGQKPTGSTKGGIYMDNDKVFYFVKHAQSVKNELIVSRLMNLILGAECVPVVKVLEDQPGMVAARMVRGFIMGMNFDGSKKIVGTADLAISLDFLGVIDRHSRNMGYVQLNAHTVRAARVDFDHAFAFEAAPQGYRFAKNNDPLCLNQLNESLKQYPVNEVLPILEKIVSISDEQIVMEIFCSGIVLSQVRDPISLKDVFHLASQLIARKAAFNKVLMELKRTPGKIHTQELGEKTKEENVKQAKVKNLEKAKEDKKKKDAKAENHKKAEEDKKKKDAKAEKRKKAEEDKKKKDAKAEKRKKAEEEKKKKDAKAEKRKKAEKDKKKKDAKAAKKKKVKKRKKVKT